MLAQVARQVLHLPPQLGEMPHARLVAGHAGLGEALRQRLVRIDELELVHHLGQPIDLPFVQVERLSHLARRTLAAIRDHVGRHGGAVLPVFLVHVLDHALAPGAARQVEIDVGPFAALFGEKPLEEQVHAHRIHGRNPEAVADGAVGGRPSALHEDVLLPAEIDNVPDDQEVADEIEFCNEIQLTCHLRARPVVEGPVPIAGADLRDLPEERDLALPVRHRICRKAVAQVAHAELQAIGQLARGVHGLGAIGKQPGHLGGRLQVALGVGREPASGEMERHVLANGGEHVEERPLFRRGIAHAAGGHHRHAERAGQAHERVVVVFLIAMQVALQLDVRVRSTERADNAIEQAADAVPLGVQQRAARHGDEPRGVTIHLVKRERALPLPPSLKLRRTAVALAEAGRRAQLHAGQQTAEVTPALL